MTGPLSLRFGRENHNPADGGRPAQVTRSSSLAFRRYLLFSSGISSTALGLALIVSFFAAAYGQSTVGRLVVADGAEVQVFAGGEQLQSLVLDEAAAYAAFDAVPAQEEGSAARSPASAINLEESSPAATATPHPGSRQAIVPPGATTAASSTPTVPPAARPPASNLAIGRIDNVNLTFYDCLDQGFCGAMKSGRQVYEGAAACSWNLPEGTRFRIVGDPTRRVYICEDRGLLDDTWVDIFFHDPADGWKWQEAVGRYGTIEVVRSP